MPTLRLPVPLTVNEKLTVSDEMSTAITALETVKKEKAEVVKVFNGRIKTHETTIHDLNEALKTGTVEREVEVREDIDYPAGVVRTMRLDTDPPTEVSTRAIDPDERQIGLGLDSPKLTTVDGDRAEEQVEASTPEEAEQLYAERLAQEKAERISAAVTVAREQVTIETMPEGGPKWRATVKYGERELAAHGETPEEAKEKVIEILVAALQEDEDAAPAPSWEDVQAASKAEAERAELEKLVEQQQADDAATGGKKAGGFKKGLKVPAGYKKRASEVSDAPKEKPAKGGKKKGARREVHDDTGNGVDTAPPEDGLAF